MSADPRASSTGTHRRRRWILGLLVGLVVAVGIGVGVHRVVFSRPQTYPWPPEACVVQGIDARCGTFTVPENRAAPHGRTIGLRVGVLPATLEPDRTVAAAYLAGGPGVPATTLTADLAEQLVALRMNRDIVLVDQRGTGGSMTEGGDGRDNGTRMAMDDLDAVRAALGYRRLDVIGSSYGATAAQVYARLHPSAVRTLTFTGGTLIDVPFFARYAANSQRALDDVAGLCAADPACREAFPGWERRFGELVRAWNADPGRMTGDELASVVHVMLLDLNTAVSVPLVVSSAATGDDGPLARAGGGDLRADLDAMSRSIWCNEPWTGLDATGPWGTDFDGYTTARIAAFRRACDAAPRRAEPASLWTLPAPSRIPVLAFVGGADPQDPIGNLAGLKRHFPDSRTVVFPHIGHQVGVGGCVDHTIAAFVARGTTRGLDTTRCDGAVVVPAFPLR